MDWDKLNRDVVGKILVEMARKDPQAALQAAKTPQLLQALTVQLNSENPDFVHFMLFKVFKAVLARAHKNNLPLLFRYQSRTLATVDKYEITLSMYGGPDIDRANDIRYVAPSQPGSAQTFYRVCGPRYYDRRYALYILSGECEVATSWEQDGTVSPEHLAYKEVIQGLGKSFAIPATVAAFPSTRGGPNEVRLGDVDSLGAQKVHVDMSKIFSHHQVIKVHELASQLDGKQVGMLNVAVEKWMKALGRYASNTTDNKVVQYLEANIRTAADASVLVSAIEELIQRDRLAFDFDNFIYKYQSELPSNSKLMGGLGRMILDLKPSHRPKLLAAIDHLHVLVKTLPYNHAARLYELSSDNVYKYIQEALTGKEPLLGVATIYTEARIKHGLAKIYTEAWVKYVETFVKETAKGLLDAGTMQEVCVQARQLPLQTLKNMADAFQQWVKLLEKTPKSIHGVVYEDAKREVMLYIRSLMLKGGEDEDELWLEGKYILPKRAQEHLLGLLQPVIGDGIVNDDTYIVAEVKEWVGNKTWEKFDFVPPVIQLWMAAVTGWAPEHRAFLHKITKRSVCDFIGRNVVPRIYYTDDPVVKSEKEALSRAKKEIMYDTTRHVSSIVRAVINSKNGINDAVMVANIEDLVGEAGMGTYSTLASAVTEWMEAIKGLRPEQRVMLYKKNKEVVYTYIKDTVLRAEDATTALAGFSKFVDVKFPGMSRPRRPDVDVWAGLDAIRASMPHTVGYPRPKTLTKLKGPDTRATSSRPASARS